MENNETNGVQTEPTKIDYESEFKALQDKYNSLNDNYIKKSDALDKVSSEVADYKRKERDSMSEDAKKAKELEELIDSKNSLEAELQQIKLEREFLGNGFSNEESQKLKGHKIPIEAVSVIADIIKKRVEDNTKSIRAEGIKTGTKTLMGSGVTGSGQKSAFAIYQESKAKKNNKVDL